MPPTGAGEPTVSVPSSAAEEVLAGGGELGALMRALDWSRTPLGPVAGWPQALKTCVRILLTSRQPMWLGWGEELIFLYNDPYKSIIGGKHPWALGRPTAEVWREIWGEIGPRIATTMQGQEGTYDEALLLIMERHGYQEETYYTFSYSPIPDERGGVGGLFCANTDDTQRVIGERQLALLRELAAATADTRTIAEACARSARALATDPHDLPFALLYLVEPAPGGGRRAVLAGTTNIAPGHPAAPEVVLLEEPGASRDGASGPVWPLAEVAGSAEPRLIADLDPSLGALPSGAWDRPPLQAAALPIAPSGETGRAGILVAGLSPYRLFDDAYRSFLGLVAGQIAAAIGNAQAYEAERQRAEALAELDRAKTAFFSNVSHEFRTPLTLLLGPVEDLLAGARGELQPQQREELAMAHRNSLRLLRLVNTLLDFSRIEAGRVQASYEPTDLAALTADLASTFRSAIERAGLRLVVECPPLPAGAQAYVDREMWEKIVLNLLSNALKFTFSGEIAVSLQASADRRAVELAVRDTGTGIPPEELPRLFERFHRVQGARARTQEGSGIGLALVQELVRLHGGTIAVESELGTGTTFRVTIPTGADHLPADRIGAARGPTSTSVSAAAFVEEALRWLPGAASPPDGPAHGADEGLAALGLRDAPPGAGPAEAEAPAARILLADDNADMRAYVTRLLAPRYRVTAVGDGAAALDAARADPPDLILSDVMMPGLDGFALLRALREDPRTRESPVVLLSARAGEEAQVEGIAAGADDYLVKPFAARELLARVGTHVQLARVRAAAAARERAARAEAEALAARNAFLLAEVREREERYRRIFDTAAVSIWEEDFSAAKRLLDELREAGVTDLRAYLDEHPEVLRRAVQSVRIVDVNAQTLRLFGASDKDELLASLETIFVPETLAVFRDELVAIFEGRRMFAAEAQLRTVRGERRDVVFSMALPEPTAAFDGVLLTLIDITEQRRAEAEARRLRIDLYEMLMQSPVPIAVLSGPDLVFELVNPPYLEVVGGRDIRGKPVLDALPELAGQGYDDFLRGVMQTGEPVVGEESLLKLERNGQLQDTYWTFIYAPLRDAEGVVDRVMAICNEVTVQVRARQEREALLAAEQAARAEAEAAAQRQALLAEATRAFSEAGPDVSSVLDAVSRRLTDLFGDACLIVLTEPDGVTLRAASYHARDEEMTAAARAAFAERPLRVGEGLAGTAVASNAPVLLPAVSAEELRGRLAPEHWEALDRLAPGTAMAVPLRVADAAVGAISLSRVDPTRPFTATDLSLLELLADRAGLVIERARLFEALAQQLSVTRTITENASLALILLDERQRCTYLNEAAECLTGFTLAELQDRPLHEYVHHTRPDGRPYPLAECPINQALPERARTQGEEVFVGRDGRFYSVAFTASPILADGRPVGTVIEVRDITEQKRAEEERQQLEREKDAFLASASHDLKNPLATIRGHAQLLRRQAARGPVDPSRLSAGLSSIDAAAAQMVTMIDALLDVTRLRLGRPLDLDRRPTDLVLLARRAAAEQQATTERHQIVVEAAEAELIGDWDAPRLERVLGNLLGNAVKFTPQGGQIAVTLRREEDADGAWAVLAVRDPGVGIPAADLPRIFEQFHRAANVASSIPGTGIGLAGARRIVEQHGGTIAVESQEGRGSTFTVRLPLAPDGPSTTPAAE